MKTRLVGMAAFGISPYLNTHLAASAGALGTLWLAQHLQPGAVDHHGERVARRSGRHHCGLRNNVAPVCPADRAATRVVVVFGMRLLERWQLDDVVGAIPVHGFAGSGARWRLGCSSMATCSTGARVRGAVAGCRCGLCLGVSIGPDALFFAGENHWPAYIHQHEQRGLDYAEHAEVGYPEPTWR